MPRRCSLGCTPTRGVLHVFPNPEKFPEQFKAWVRVVSGQDECNFNYKIMRICDRHFTEKDRNRYNRLNALAVPSLFLCEQPSNPCCLSNSTSEQTFNQPEVSDNYHQSSSGKIYEKAMEKSSLDNPETSDIQQSTYSGFRIALVQMLVTKDKKENIKVAVEEIHKAKAQGAQLVTLPEFFCCPYSIQSVKDYAEPVPDGEACRALQKAAKDAGVCLVGGSLPEDANGKYFNTCTVWNEQGKLIALHRKVHLFDIDIPGKITFKESDILTPGDQITTFEFRGAKIGLGICYDLRFFEMAQVMAKEGCTIIIYPGAFNMTTGPKHWELLGRGRANDLQLWVALVSPARNTKASYVAWGHTMLIDPWANVTHSLKDEHATIVADVDLNMVEEVRAQIPVRRQRRTDLYDTIAKC